ncbi:HAMP domain-containing sensor histidine kinase [Polaromonas sp.]|uniref:sensor histidine kinase n=1 Tax=Polaromonas sp. TaxID=1869339 RepID=UPI003263FFFC
MSRFLATNRDDLIARCKAKVERRPLRAATPEQLTNGIPIFLRQLEGTLEAEERGQSEKSLKISGASGGDQANLSEMGVTATAHGKQLLEFGFSVDQVVHDYGDLCQAITDLAFEQNAPFGIDEFRTLNRCLDNAIADAVTEFSFQRDSLLARQHDVENNERMGFLIHELRNSLSTAVLALSALELGALPVAGATGAVLKRSLASLKVLIDRAIADVRAKAGAPTHLQVFSLASFIEDARNAASLYAECSDCTLTVATIDPLLGISVNRDLMLAALANLIQNAFKFTHPGTEVTLRAYANGPRVLIEVKDHCGGLPHGDAERMFAPFSQGNKDKSGLGLGLSIARHSVEDDDGTLSVQDLPGTGCIFTISLPRHMLQ